MATSLLCETVTGRSTADLITARDAATAGDMVEVRLDGVTDLDVAAVVRGARVPVLATCRPAWEGGLFEGSEEDRAAILGRALALGAAFVDVEWRALRGLHGDTFRRVVARDPARVVVSSHDFEGVPADLKTRVRDMRACGARLIKVAVTPSCLTETLDLMDVAGAGHAVVVAMGDTGLPSRLLATRFGSRWTYAGNAVAPGQIPAGRMIHEFRFRQIGPATRLFGVISTNALHSLSPSMHNAAFEAAGLDAVYVPLKAADFEDFLTFAAVIGIEGASITIPFKLDALRAAATADDLTQKVGAANTLRRRGSSWDATNTDVEGFLAPLDALLGRALDRRRVAVAGAGGSARAVAAGLKARGAHVTVHARRVERARVLADALEVAVGSWPVPAGEWDVLVNCTPLGGAGMRDQSPVPAASLRPPDGERSANRERVVYDLTYGPGDSRLLADAREAGFMTLDGLPMLVAQAERQFEWWTGRRPREGVMHYAALARLTGSEGHLQRGAGAQGGSA
jgi:3-dehydroquinate dehydratase/shikimate dehydrogenase